MPRYRPSFRSQRITSANGFSSKIADDSRSSGIAPLLSPSPPCSSSVRLHTSRLQERLWISITGIPDPQRDGALWQRDSHHPPLPCPGFNGIKIMCSLITINPPLTNTIHFGSSMKLTTESSQNLLFGDFNPDQGGKTFSPLSPRAVSPSSFA